MFSEVERTRLGEGAAWHARREDSLDAARSTGFVAIRWCAASVAWAATVGATAVLAGFAAGAIALVGFGADSITDGLASAVLVWRFGHEKAGQHSVERVGQRAARAVGAILIAIGLYVSATAIAALAGHSAPDQSTVGLALTAASVLSCRFSLEQSSASPAPCKAQRCVAMGFSASLGPRWLRSRWPAWC